MKKRKPAYDAELEYRASQCIAQGALTNSKRPSCLVRGVYPTHLSHGNGCMVWDASGREYVDFIGGLGSNLIGYGNTEIAQAVSVRALKGVTLSLGTTLEVEVAEQIKGVFPFVERVKFLKTGSEACTAAVRIARAKTGRKLVLSEAYHGWHDEFVSLVPPALGVVPHEWIAKLEGQTDLGAVAAVIIEPIQTDISPERVAWLRVLRELCTQSGAALIFDEVITGFRFPKFSVSNYYGITPDLICLGKAIGGGFPLSVVGGKAEFMECGEYFVSSTFAGDTVALTAASEVIRLLHGKYQLNDLWEAGGRFQAAFNETMAGVVSIQGYPTRGVLVGDPLQKALFMQEACRGGLLFGPSFFFTFPHMELTEQVLSTCADIATRIKTGSVTLNGEMPSSPFASKLRSQ